MTGELAARGANLLYEAVVHLSPAGPLSFVRFIVEHREKVAGIQTEALGGRRSPSLRPGGLSREPGPSESWIV